MIWASLIYSPALRRYTNYAVVSTNHAAFFIGGGGIGSSYVSAIAKFENDNWSKLENLKKNRLAHGSITIGTKTFVIGGDTDDGS